MGLPTLAPAGLPAPPPVPALFRRRTKWLIAFGSGVAVLVLAGVAAIFIIRAASAAANTDAADLAHDKAVYGEAMSSLQSEATIFHTEVDNATRAGDPFIVETAAIEFAGNLADFDSTVSRLHLPASASGDMSAMLGDDSTLEQDLTSPPDTQSAEFDGWVSQIGDEYIAASDAHDKMSTDLGLADSAFPGTPQNSV